MNARRKTKTQAENARRKRQRQLARENERIVLSPIDRLAEHEQNAIDKALKTHTVDFGKRLNRYYICDGQKFNTGKKHRRVCVGMTATKHATHKRKKTATRHTDLQLLNTHARICNPELYHAKDKDTLLNPLSGVLY